MSSPASPILNQAPSVGGLTAAQGWLDTRPAPDGTQGLFKLTTGGHLVVADVDLGVTYVDLGSWVTIEDRWGVDYFVRKLLLTAATTPMFASIDTIPAVDVDQTGAQTFTREDDSKWARLVQGGAGSNWLVGWDLVTAVTKGLALMVGGFNFQCDGVISLILSEGAIADPNDFLGYSAAVSITGSEIRLQEFQDPGVGNIDTDPAFDMSPDNIEMSRNVALAIWADADNEEQEAFYKFGSGGDNWNRLLTGANANVTQFDRVLVRGTNDANSQLNMFAPLFVFGEEVV